jgi:hypothetical protein
VADVPSGLSLTPPQKTKKEAAPKPIIKENSIQLFIYLRAEINS